MKYCFYFFCIICLTLTFPLSFLFYVFWLKYEILLLKVFFASLFYDFHRLSRRLKLKGGETKGEGRGRGLICNNFHSPHKKCIEFAFLNIIIIGITFSLQLFKIATFWQIQYYEEQNIRFIMNF